MGDRAFVTKRRIQAVSLLRWVKLDYRFRGRTGSDCSTTPTLQVVFSSQVTDSERVG